MFSIIQVLGNIDESGNIGGGHFLGSRDNLESAIAVGQFWRHRLRSQGANVVVQRRNGDIMWPTFIELRDGIKSRAAILSE